MSAAVNNIAAIIPPESVILWVCAVIRVPGKDLILLLEIQTYLWLSDAFLPTCFIITNYHMTTCDNGEPTENYHSNLQLSNFIASFSSLFSYLPITLLFWFILTALIVSFSPKS